MAPKTHAAGHVYFVLAERSRLVKIGWSISPEMRLETLQTGSPEPLVLAHSMPGTGRLEKSLHAKYAEHRTHGEWFRLEGALAADLLQRRHFPEPDPAKPKKYRGSEGVSPRLWKHRNGVYYVLFGRRLQRRVSAQTKDEQEASKFLTNFSAAG